MSWSSVAIAGRVRMVQSSPPWRGHEADEVVHVNPLHDNDNGAVDLVVEPGQKRVVIPLVDRILAGLREGIGGLDGIVDEDEAAAAAGQGTSDGGGEAHSLLGGHHFRRAVLQGREGKAREHATIPVRLDHSPEVDGVLGGEVRGIADADDAACRIMPHHEGREGHRGHNGFEGARRQVDDQPADLALADEIQVTGNGMQVPVVQEGHPGREGHEAALHEAHEILSLDGVGEAALLGSRLGQSQGQRCIFHGSGSALGIRLVAGEEGLDDRRIIARSVRSITVRLHEVCRPGAFVMLQDKLHSFQVVLQPGLHGAGDHHFADLHLLLAACRLDYDLAIQHLGHNGAGVPGAAGATLRVSAVARLEAVVERRAPIADALLGRCGGLQLLGG